MYLHTLVLAAGVALVAGCDNAPAPRADGTPPQSGASSGSTTTTTPANIGAPGSLEEKKQGANPVQGQVDPKQSEQHRDFKQRGDAAGPSSAETAPSR